MRWTRSRSASGRHGVWRSNGVERPWIEESGVNRGLHHSETHVGGFQHQHIAEVRWTNPADATTAEHARDHGRLDQEQGGQAYVTDGTSTIAVGVVETNPPYIRTYADGVWTDTLLALPTF